MLAIQLLIRIIAADRRLRHIVTIATLFAYFHLGVADVQLALAEVVGLLGALHADSLIGIGRSWEYLVNDRRVANGIDHNVWRR